MLNKTLAIPPIVAFMPVMMIFTYYLLRRQLSADIGYIGDMIVIKNGANRYSVGKGSQIYYTNNLIMIDKVYIPFTGNHSIFDMQEIVKEVMPRLKDANFVTPGVMTNMIIRRMGRLQLLMIGFGILIVLYLFFVTNN